MFTLGHFVSILLIWSQNLLNSKPVLMYSACSPQLSTDVNIINSFTLSSSHILFIFYIFYYKPDMMSDKKRNISYYFYTLISCNIYIFIYAYFIFIFVSSKFVYLYTIFILFHIFILKHTYIFKILQG